MTDPAIPAWINCWVVTVGTDPFEPGGEPIAAYLSEQEAWDRMAEEVADDASEVWDDQWRRRDRTLVRVMADEASVYAVTGVHLAARDTTASPKPEPLSHLLRSHLSHIHGRQIPPDAEYVIQCVEQWENSSVSPR